LWSFGARDVLRILIAYIGHRWAALWGPGTPVAKIYYLVVEAEIFRVRGGSPSGSKEVDTGIYRSSGGG